MIFYRRIQLYIDIKISDMVPDGKYYKKIIL